MTCAGKVCLQGTCPYRKLSVFWKCGSSLMSSLMSVRLDDEHERSTICGQQREAINSRSSFSGFLVLNEKTSLFYVSNEFIVYVDTHSHGPSGPVLVTAELKELDKFCYAVWELEGNDAKTNGKFVLVDF